ncbi:hypothetical protein [Modestobacter roseus]|uniref:Uncharacterized protein n=1 Tax=Modestobacter roseus TaxID=1181884 RepID=A0A562ITF2_9ACTN|nr:hypothetical protein [Modestobacter roseus]MQA33739.1 hypothetical protein [Modestobacter roseus]TWH74311.1 hypothetical protein JD78_02846 [Modestobacter roseus]
MAEHDSLGRQQTEVFPSGSSPTDPPRRRDVDTTALVAGVFFIGLAVLLMTGIDLPLGWFNDGFAWVLLIGAGLALLVNELRRARRRR